MRLRVSRIGKPGSPEDHVVGEEPLEIRVQTGDSEPAQLGITMRTPGADIELAAGFLWSEGLLRERDDLISITTCKDKELSPREQENTVVAHVRPGAPALDRTLQRRFTMSSACGVCGSSQINDLHARGCRTVSASSLSDEQLASLTEQLRPQQRIFDRTGGLHAAGLFDASGNLVALREDVGRHNAVDKVIGHALMHELLPLHDYALAISGRGGFEIIQKAVAAQISAVVAVSAPTSLAVETAREFGLTLLGFARDGSATKYSPAP
jgi:FdhD protein